MSPRIMCHHMTLSDADKDLITEKIQRLRKYFERLTEVSVILDATKNGVQAEILTLGPQMNLRFRDQADEVRTAFESVLNKAERGLRRNKEKRFGDKKTKRHNITIRRFNPMDFDFATDFSEDDGTGKTILHESVEPKPMSLEEAHLQLAARDKGLLVFLNAKTEKVNILHRTQEDHVELVELEGAVDLHPDDTLEVQFST